MQKRNHLYALGSLQLIAIVAIVMGHLWIKDSTFMNSLCVSFCFLYSGFFTAKTHNFGASYGVKEHVRYMGDKLAKIYPMHLLALALCIYVFVVHTGSPLSMKTLLYHLSMLSPWSSNPDIYFGYNAVAWWICVLFFLYLVAPLVVKLLRRLKPAWQCVAMAVLLALEFIGGYSPDKQTPSLLLSYYHMYEFPPIRILDFATGVVLYNLTQSAGWQRLAGRLTPNLSTLVEVGGIILFGVLYWIEKNYLDCLCFRAFCVQIPSIAVLLMTFVLTSNKTGAISRLLSIKPLVVMQRYCFEIYLLQVGMFFLLQPLCERLGIVNNQVLYFVVQNALLLLAAWAAHEFFVKPLYRLLTIGPMKRQ